MEYIITMNNTYIRVQLRMIGIPINSEQSLPDETKITIQIPIQEHFICRYILTACHSYS